MTTGPKLDSYTVYFNEDANEFMATTGRDALNQWAVSHGFKHYNEYCMEWAGRPKVVLTRLYNLFSWPETMDERAL